MRLLRLRRRPVLACQEVVELVTAYLEDGLSPRRRTQVQAHLDACEHCSLYLDQIRATIAELGALPMEGLSDDAYMTLSEAFRDLPSDEL
jgi:anti-sigma factor RsiW